jgi:hypothetical protein
MHVLSYYTPGKALQLGQCLTSIDEEPTDVTTTATSSDGTTVIDADTSNADTAAATDSTDVTLVGDYYLALRDDGSVVICRGTPLQGNRHFQHNNLNFTAMVILLYLCASDSVHSLRLQIWQSHVKTFDKQYLAFVLSAWIAKQLSRVVLCTIVLMARLPVTSNSNKWKLYGKLKRDVIGKILNNSTSACSRGSRILITVLLLMTLMKRPCCSPHGK